MRRVITTKEDLDSLGAEWQESHLASLPPETPASSNLPRVLTVSEILAHDASESSMLIEGYLPAKGASLLVGAAKSGKTIMAVQIGIATASGFPLYGRYRVLNSGPVLFVEQDDPAGISSVQSILERSSVPVTGIPFYLVPGVSYQFGPELIGLLELLITKHSLSLIILDSYTALRGPRPKGVDIVKAEQSDLRHLDALAKRRGCAVLIITHSSKGSAGMDWSEKAAGTFAMSAATESQIHVSRFSELENAAPERLVRIRGRHSEDLEAVLRFRHETLDYSLVLEGGAASYYPALLQLQTTFGSQAFSPQELSLKTGLSRATSHRHIERLYRSGVIQKRAYGQYVLVCGTVGIPGRLETPETV